MNFPRRGTWLVLASCSILLLGCSKKKTDTGPAVPAAQPKAPPPPGSEGLDGLFKAGTVELPKVLDGVGFGDEMAQLEAIAKPLAQGKPWQPTPSSKMSLRPIFHTDNKTLRYLEVTLPKGSLPGLEKLWGSPRNVNIDGRERRQVWLDDKKTMQAIFRLEDTGDKVTFWPITSLNSLLALEPAEGARRPLVMELGQAIKAVENRYARKLNRPGGFAAWLPPLAYRTRPVTVFFDNHNGLVNRVSMRVEGDQSGQFEKSLVNEITKIWGTPDAIGNSRTWTSAKPSSAQLKMRKELNASAGPRPPRFHIALTVPAVPSSPKP